MGTPNVKDTNKVKRKKASLPTTKPINAHGSWLTNRYIVNNYILLDALGQGSYAEVRLCKEKTNDQLYAIKIMNKEVRTIEQFARRHRIDRRCERHNT